MIDHSASLERLDRWASGVVVSSIPSEEAVLGGAMFDNGAWPSVRDLLTATDFYRRDHQLIFAAMDELANEGEALDAVTVAERLDRNGHLEDAGGLAYLAKLTRETASAAHITSYAKIVRESSQSRRVADIAKRLARNPSDLDSHLIELAALRDTSRATSIHQTISLADVLPSLEPNYIVKGVLGPASVVGMIAASGDGKTFATIDMGCHASLGLRWFNHRTHEGMWVYLCLEGFHAAKNRLAALKIAKPHLADAPFEMSAFPLNLMLRSSCVQFVKLVRQRLEATGATLSVLVVDTFNAATPGCPENDAGPMGQALGNVRFIRDELGATIILVHHLGKDATRGARGHSSFKAALDTELTIERNGDTRVLTATKQRDFETGQEIAAFTLKSVLLGVDDDGDEVRSCVVEPTNFIPIKQAPTGKCQRQLLAELERRCAAGDVGIWSEGELREIARSLGMQRSSARDAVHGLRQLEYFTPTVGGSRLSFIPAAGAKGRNVGETPIPAQSGMGEMGERSIDLARSPMTSPIGATNR